MLRKAKINDAQEIYALINTWAKKKVLLARSLNYIYEHIRDFWVWQKDKRIVGVCALHIVGWQNLAEVKSLAINPRYQGKNIGKTLIQTCLKEAKDLGIRKVFVLTFIPNFFKKLGFHKIDKNTLPHKVWSDCIECVYFPHCGEEAMIIEL